MLFFQALISGFVLIIIYKIYLKTRKKELGTSTSLGWILFWLLTLYFLWQPESASFLATKLGIGRGVDLVIYLSLLIIFYLLFKIFVKLDKLEGDICKITTKIALRAPQSEHQEKNSSHQQLTDI